MHSTPITGSGAVGRMGGGGGGSHLRKLVEVR